VIETEEQYGKRIFELSDYLIQGKNTLIAVLKNRKGRCGITGGVKLASMQHPVWMRKAFNGLCQVIVRSTEKKGVMTLTAESDGLLSASVSVILK
jgi:hypothetical protein